MAKGFLLLFLKATHLSLRDLSSLTRDRTLALGNKPQSPNHWTTREVPGQVFLSFAFSHPSITQACCEHASPSQQLDIVPNLKRSQCPGDVYFHARGRWGWQTAVLHEVTLGSQDPALWWLCRRSSGDPSSSRQAGEESGEKAILTLKSSSQWEKTHTSTPF